MHYIYFSPCRLFLRVRCLPERLTPVIFLRWLTSEFVVLDGVSCQIIFVIECKTFHKLVFQSPLLCCASYQFLSPHPILGNSILHLNLWHLGTAFWLCVFLFPCSFESKPNFLFFFKSFLINPRISNFTEFFLVLDPTCPVELPNNQPTIKKIKLKNGCWGKKNVFYFLLLAEEIRRLAFHTVLLFNKRRRMEKYLCNIFLWFNKFVLLWKWDTNFPSIQL